MHINCCNALLQAKPGLVMNLMCCGVQLFMIHTLGVAMFDLNTFPSWAEASNITDTVHVLTNGTALSA